MSKKKSSWGKRLHLEPEDLPKAETWAKEFRRLSEIGFFKGIENAAVLYLAFRIHLRNYVYEPKKPGSRKPPATSIYGARMHSGDWIHEHSPEELQQAEELIEKQRRKLPAEGRKYAEATTSLES